ncbi:MAG: hypothetical protein IT464_12730 [Planctomycetes bacterium]|nr:hypothetical protein [Planctomycetota bacterium]
MADGNPKPGRSVAFHGGRWIGREGGGGLTFRFDVDNDATMEITRRYTAELERQARVQGRLAGPGGVPGTLPGDPMGPSASPVGSRKPMGEIQAPDTMSGRIADRLGIPRRHLSVGAEGLRVGHVRMSRSGIGLSEKTFVGSSTLALAAVTGQVLGRTVDAVGKGVDAYRRGENPGEIITRGMVGGAANVLRSGLELFGFRFFASGFSALAPQGSSFSINPDSFDSLYNEAWEAGIAYIANTHHKRERERREKVLRKQRIEEYQLMEKTWAEMTEFLDPASEAARVRTELAISYSESRAMVRSATGRPLWKVVGYSSTEGVQ